MGDIVSFDFAPTLYLADLTDTGSISGTIFTTMGTEGVSDDEPLANASVSVYRGATEIASSATTASGSYKVLGLAEGEYTVVATAVGYLDESRTVTVDEGGGDR